MSTYGELNHIFQFIMHLLNFRRHLYLINRKGISEIEKSDKRSLDETDSKIIKLLILKKTNKEISRGLDIPLSTVQRRTRNILQSGIVTVKILPDYKQMGFKKGLLHIYLNNGHIRQAALKFSEMPGILSSSIHVGNSDIVCDFIYTNNEQLIDTISNLKLLHEVKNVSWSEQVYSIDTDPKNIVSLVNIVKENGRKIKNQ